MQSVRKDGGNDYILGLEFIEVDLLSNRFRLYLYYFALASPLPHGEGCFVT